MLDKRQAEVAQEKQLTEQKKQAYELKQKEALKSMQSLAVVCFMAGLASWVGMPLIGSIYGIIMGHKALGLIREWDLKEGRGLTVFGLFLAYLNVMASIIIIVLIIGAQGHSI